MSRKNRESLSERVARAAEAALAHGKSVSAIDIFFGIGWLTEPWLKQWQHGQIDCLERGLQVNPERIAEAVKLLEAWASAKGLQPSESGHVGRTPQRQPLRLTQSGDPAIERLFRTHWVSPKLSERQRERVVEKATTPELVVILPLKAGWTCHRCGGTGDFLIMESPGPACLRCAGLGDLEFLAAGDALLTRRTKAKSARHAVVVRFSRTRKRYERQGLLVDPQALADAQRELAEEGRR